MQQQGFWAKFAAMQAELPIITKSQTGQVGNKKFSYADLPDIRRDILPVLQKHGFGYRWSQDSAGITCFLVCSEGEVSSFMDLPHVALSEGYDPYRTMMQTRGMMLGYARRMTLLDVLGLITDDEDADSQPTTEKKTANPEKKTPPPTPEPEKRRVSFSEAMEWPKAEAGPVQPGKKGQSGAVNSTRKEFVVFATPEESVEYSINFNFV